MVSLSDNQIDTIHDLLLGRGITLDSLRFDLLDHVCCMVEEKMETGVNFQIALKDSIQQWFEL